MEVHGQIKISSPKERIWGVISDIENAANVFKDIKSIEILEKPKSEILGTKWKEVRVFVGKEATETMWICEVKEYKSFTSEAKNSGCLYHSTITLETQNDGVVVTKSFKSTPLTLFAKMMTPVMYLMKGTLKKCLDRDLYDLKCYLEEKG